METTKMTHEEIAQYLKINPEELEKMEQSYQMSCMEFKEDFFDYGAKDVNSSELTEISTVLEALIERIVKELLQETIILGMDGKAEPFLCEKPIPVTKEEIMRLPENLRPQLTGRYVQKDIPDNSSEMILLFLKKYMDTGDQQAYGMFRSGLDLLDLDPISYAMLGKNPNSMEYWLPKIYAAGQNFFQFPKTQMIRVPITLLQTSRMEYSALTATTLQIVDRYCQCVFGLDFQKDYFVKTGVFSSKFDFRNAHVQGEKEVKELGEYLLFISNQASQLASLMHGTYGAATTNVWAVRDYIHDVENNPCIYKGLPLHTEYRVFVDFDTDEILGISPYWRSDIMEKRFSRSNGPHDVHDDIVYRMHEKILMDRYEKNKELVLKHIKEMLPKVQLLGQWSVDIMQNGDVFYLIDMALAKNSALNDCVPKMKLKEEKMEWIPCFSM